MMKFSGAMIGSHQPKVLGEFYQDVLGQPDFQDGDWYGWAKDAHLMIGAHSDITAVNTSPQRIMLVCITTDVAGDYDRLVNLGAGGVAKPYQPDAAKEMWLATVSDPDGNYVQLSMPWK